eukprot:gene1620-1960_t
MEALRFVPGGYLCRMQEGDLKYMLAFASARGALEWCLLVQEAAMYLNWPDDSDSSVPLSGASSYSAAAGSTRADERRFPNPWVAED